MRKKTGFTLIELVMFIVIATICFLPVIMIFGEVVQKSIVPGIIGVATSLAEEKLEPLLALGYSGIRLTAQQTQGNFSAPFSDYSFVTEWHYVDISDLNTSVDPTVTSYINLKVSLRHSGVSDIVLTTLFANY